MDRVRKNTQKDMFRELDTEEKIFYMCPFCNFNSETRANIPYHIVGFHRVMQEFFDDF